MQCKQRGVSALEFALVFPVFFIIFYAIISYGLIMMAQQSISLAAAEGARAALRHADTENQRVDKAETAAIGQGSAAFWLANRLTFQGKKEPCAYSSGDECFRATVTYADYRERPLTPLLMGPLMRFTVPEKLSSTAVIQLN